jgi:threonine dehydrogenase-like Zn-dependent dehydrogenase
MSGDKTPGMTPFDGMKKAVSVKSGDMVSWNSSGGSASGKVVRVISSGKINVPDSSFSIEGTEDDPAALIQLYRDGKPTETKVGHKVSTLKKK